MKVVVLLVVLCVVVGFCSAALRRTEFTVRGEGTCPRTNNYCKVKANSQEQLELISPADGIRQQVVYLKGSYADFTFNVERISGNHFYTDGNVTFGTHMARTHTIYFNYTEAGLSVPGPDPNHVLISGLYKIIKGAGVFKGAAGVMTVVGEVEISTGKVMFELSGYLYHESGDDTEALIEKLKKNH